MAWDLTAATYDGVSLSVSAEDTFPVDVVFKPDGTAMYVVGTTNNRIYQYTLGTAWDLSTASYASKFVAVGAQDSNPTGLEFKPDGTKMYHTGNSSDRVFQYTLATAWDISTATYDSVNVFSGMSNPHGLAFKPDDGTKMYLLSEFNFNLRQYTLGTAWNVSTAVYDGVLVDNLFSRGIFFSDDGIHLLGVYHPDNEIRRYDLSTPWDISTAVFVSSHVLAEDSSPSGVAFKDDGTKMYMVGFTNDAVYQYSLAALLSHTVGMIRMT